MSYYFSVWYNKVNTKNIKYTEKKKSFPTSSKYINLKKGSLK